MNRIALGADDFFHAALKAAPPGVGGKLRNHTRLRECIASAGEKIGIVLRINIIELYIVVGLKGVMHGQHGIHMAIGHIVLGMLNH
jgi:hypothetical protein